MSIHAIDRPSGNGFSAATLLLSIGARSLPNKLVVQAAPPSESALFEHYDIARTFHTQRILARHAVPVPSVRWLCEDSSRIGAPFYVMDFVEGRIPPDRPPYHAGGWLAEAEPRVRESTWMAGLDAMACLHSVNATVLDFLKAPIPARMAETRVSEWLAFHDTLKENGDPAIQHALKQLGNSAPSMSSVCAHWGDAKLGNMIFDKGSVAAILDWELSGVSAPEEDLAHWFAVDWFLSKGVGHRRLPGLPGVDNSIAHYVERSGRSVSALDWWFAFSLVRMALIFQRARSVVLARQPQKPLRPNALTAHLEQILDGTTWANYTRN